MDHGYKVAELSVSLPSAERTFHVRITVIRILKSWPFLSLSIRTFNNRVHAFFVSPDMCVFLVSYLVHQCAVSGLLGFIKSPF